MSKSWLIFWSSLIFVSGAFAYPTNNITLTFNCAATNLGPAIPDNFIGMTLSRSFINGAGGSAQVFNPTWHPGASKTTWQQFTNLLGQIGIHHWRTICGYSGDNPDPTPAQDNQFFATLAASGVTNVIYSLHGFCESDSSDNIAAATNILLTPLDARLLESFAINNEPNFNIFQECPTTKWTEPQYEDLWNMVFTQTENGIAAAGLPWAPFSGPDDGGDVPVNPGPNTPQNWLPQFAIDETSKQYFVMATQHDYDSSAQPLSPDAIGMATTNLSPARVTSWNQVYTSLLNGAPTWPNDWYGNKLRYRITEASAFNNAGGTGAPDGNTNGQNFSTALWELDFCHWWAQRGCAGVNPFNRPVDYSAPMQLDYTTGNWTAMPYSYGLKAFNLGGHGLPFTNTAAFFSNPNNINMTAYGVLSADRSHLYVTVINKTFDAVGAHAAYVTIPSPANFSPTNAQYLLLSSTAYGQDGNATNVQTAYLGGATIPNSGPWTGAWSGLTLGNQGQINMVVQPATAVIIDIQGGPTAPTIQVAPAQSHIVVNYVGTLVSSTNLAGPYVLVPGATTPYIAPATNAQQFFRSEAN
ncbi:MAG TPA: hypothetical protein VH280_21820 [Verrucomicrobiae bacterium]|jgi:hypothetical protein|nr:hypothetical protein [Verrucomicrobiae bacterium]